MGPKDLLGAGEAAGAAARTHAQPGDVLELLGGDGLTSFQCFQQVLETHVFAVADIGFGRRFGPAGSQLQRFGIILFQDEAVGVGQFAGEARSLHDGDVRLAGLFHHALDDAFAHPGTVVIDQIDFLGSCREVELQR